MAALARLDPVRQWNKFPDWYYLGPYLPVQDSDLDLPIRGNDALSDHDKDKESDRTIDGERMIAPFNDANSISETLGILFGTSAYPLFGVRSYLLPQTNLAKASDRLRDKIRRSRNPVKNSFFEDAIRMIELAKDMFFDRCYEEGRKLVCSAEKLIEEGNRQRKPPKSFSG